MKKYNIFKNRLKLLTFNYDGRDSKLNRILF